MASRPSSASITLADSLTVDRRDGRGASIDVSGAEVGPPDQNLAVLAANAVLESVGHPFAVHLTLTKRIPVRAGLGGGSSDAAAALLATNHLAGDAIPRHELLQIAARLGSDVPFFVSGAPLALAWNRGERMLRLPALPAAPLLLLTPACLCRDIRGIRVDRCGPPIGGAARSCGIEPRGVVGLGRHCAYGGQRLRVTGVRAPSGDPGVPSKPWCEPGRSCAA